MTTALLAVAAPARGDRLTRIDLPSSGNVDASLVHFNGTGHPGRLVANVLLPTGFDPAKRYPVLYLLHGSGENYASWVTKTKADVVTRDLDAIVVMPDAASGFYVNQYNGGRRGSPGWERYFLDEAIPEVERRYPIRAGRSWHAIAGFSMGGYGAAFLASQRPDYFGAVAPMSGFLAPRRPEMPTLFPIATGQSFENLFGPADSAYAEGHDPIALIANLRETRLFVISGNGVPDPAKPPSASLQSTVTDSAGEAELALHGAEFADAARAAGEDVTHTVLLGVHTHPYWNEHLRRFLAWEPFATVAEHPQQWTYRTVADRGHAWELTYQFTQPPLTVQEIRRRDGGYSATGSGTVELCDGDGHGLIAGLPFARRALTRSVSVRLLDRSRVSIARRGRVRVALTTTEPATVVVDAVLQRGTRKASVKSAPMALAAGQRRTTGLRLTRAARRLLHSGPTRLKLIARHGSCAGGRWTTSAARLRS